MSAARAYFLNFARRAASLVRGLRFRLAVSYVIFFAVLLVAIGMLFRVTLRRGLDRDVEATLEEEWGAAKGYLRIERGRPIWLADSRDPEEAYIVERLRHIYMLADSRGRRMETSKLYESIGADSPKEIVRILELRAPEIRVRHDSDGIPYLIKAGAVPDDRGRPYFFAIGRSLEANERTVDNFTRQYLILVPALIVLAGLLGWLLAGRAVRPLNLVAHAAAGISGSNFTTRIPKRGAGDELDHLIDNFNRMTERLGQSFDQIRQFSTDVSHELRTPLTAIRGQLEVALFTAKTREQYRDAIVNALEDVEKLSSIVRALLLLSQAESGQVVLQKSTLNLAEVAGNVVEQFQIPAEEKGLSLTEVSDPEVIAHVDRTQFERLLSNLLSNAVKYTPFGGRVCVRLGADPQREGWALLRVEDTGMGISPENLPHIFDRFYRVRNPETNRVQGLGLGLSFVAWIAYAHGGAVEVESTPGGGSTFTVRLPLAPVPASADRPEPVSA